MKKDQWMCSRKHHYETYSRNGAHWSYDTGLQGRLRQTSGKPTASYYCPYDQPVFLTKENCSSDQILSHGWCFQIAILMASDQRKKGGATPAAGRAEQPRNYQALPKYMLLSTSPPRLPPVLSESKERGFPGGAVVKNLPANAGHTGSSPGPGRSHMPRSNKAHVPQLLSPRSRAREPQLLSACTTTTEPASQKYWACRPQLLKPVCLEPVLRNKRCHCNEKPVHRNEE